MTLGEVDRFRRYLQRARPRMRTTLHPSGGTGGFALTLAQDDQAIGPLARYDDCVAELKRFTR